MAESPQPSIEECLRVEEVRASTRHLLDLANAALRTVAVSDQTPPPLRKGDHDAMALIKEAMALLGGLVEPGPNSPEGPTIWEHLDEG